MNSQEHQFWVECQTAQDRITDQLIELGIAHGDKHGFNDAQKKIGKSLQNANSQANGTKQKAPQPNRNGHKKVAVRG